MNFLGDNFWGIHSRGSNYNSGTFCTSSQTSIRESVRCEPCWIFSAVVPKAIRHWSHYDLLLHWQKWDEEWKIKLSVYRDLDHPMDKEWQMSPQTSDVSSYLVYVICEFVLKNSRTYLFFCSTFPFKFKMLSLLMSWPCELFLCAW